MVSARTPHAQITDRSVADERLHRKQRLALAFRIFGKLGFDEGVAGHITARDPEFPDRFWVNPFGLSFKLITVDDLILVDHSGTVVEGTWPVNQAAFAIHSAIHAARPDVVAAAHSHSKFGRAYATLRRELQPLTQDSAIFYEDHVLFDEYTGVVNDVEEGKKIAHALGDHKAAILRNHGLLTVGTTIEETIFWYVTMERTCEVELLARAAGEVVPMDLEVARATQRQLGGHAAGWFCGQPLFDWIADLEPEAYGSTTPVA